MKPQTPEEIRKVSYSENEALSAIALYELLNSLPETIRVAAQCRLIGSIGKFF